MQRGAGGLAVGGRIGQACAALFGRAGHLQQRQRLRHVGPRAHGIHRDALDQALAKRLQAVQRVDQIRECIALEGGTKAQRQDGVEARQELLHHLALEAMRFVDDEHWPNLCQRLHVAARLTEQIGLHAALVDQLAVAGKRLIGGHHHADARICRVDEAAHRLLGIVEDVDVLVAVLARKKTGRGLQAAQRALADRVAGHQHDEFRQLETLMQPVDGLDKSKGLARAGFHQHVQRQRGRGRAGHRHAARRDAIVCAHVLDIGADLRVSLLRGKGGVGLCAGGLDKTHVVQRLRHALHRLRLVSQAGVLKLHRRHGLAPQVQAVRRQALVLQQGADAQQKVVVLHPGRKHAHMGHGPARRLRRLQQFTQLQQFDGLQNK